MSLEGVNFWPEFLSGFNIGWSKLVGMSGNNHTAVPSDLVLASCNVPLAGSQLA